MYIYNVTINISDRAHDEWLRWMKEKHIPDVMSTGLFGQSRILEVMVEEEQGRTYTVQYTVRDRETLQLYMEVYAPKLQAGHKEKFGDEFAAFRSLLRLEHEHQK